MLLGSSKRICFGASSLCVSCRLFSSEVSSEAAPQIQPKTGFEKLVEMNLHNQDENEGFFTLLEGYYDDGFHVFDKRITGAICAFPKSVLQWNGVKNCEDLNMESLFIFTLVRPRILLIGTGERTELIDPDLRMKLRQYGIVVECLASNQAVATFNILNEERRDVAAAILTMEAEPPNYLKQSEKYEKT